MRTMGTRAEQSQQIVVPDKFRGDPRLTIWYRHGFSQAHRGFTPTEPWIRRLNEDKAASRAYWAGHRDGEAVSG